MYNASLVLPYSKEKVLIIVGKVQSVSGLAGNKPRLFSSDSCRHFIKVSVQPMQPLDKSKKKASSVVSFAFHSHALNMEADTLPNVFTIIDL